MHKMKISLPWMSFPNINSSSEFVMETEVSISTQIKFTTVRLPGHEPAEDPHWGWQSHSKVGPGILVSLCQLDIS